MEPVRFLYPFPLFVFSSALWTVDFGAEFQCQPENMIHTTYQHNRNKNVSQ